ncbi:hypothetical protein BKA80DRAFT_38920 [Phyllosticta citrichinensis]
MIRTSTIVVVKVVGSSSLLHPPPPVRIMLQTTGLPAWLGWAGWLGSKTAAAPPRPPTSPPTCPSASRYAPIWHVKLLAAAAPVLSFSRSFTCLTPTPPHSIPLSILARVHMPAHACERAIFLVVVRSLSAGWLAPLWPPTKGCSRPPFTMKQNQRKREREKKKKRENS